MKNKLEYKYHPLIEGLKIAEDGSKLIYQGEPLTIRWYQSKYQSHATPSVVIPGIKGSVRVSRLLAEAFIGLRPSGDLIVRLKVESKPLHYTNLYWGKRGRAKSKDSYDPEGWKKRIKLTEADIINIEKKREEGVMLKDLLEEYNICNATYYRTKKKFGV